MKLVYKIILFFTIIALPLLSFAPPGGGWNPGNTEPTVPLGGGLVFLIASAIFYTVRKIISSNKKSS